MEKRIIPISLPVTGNDEWQALKEPLDNRLVNSWT